ncbi:MAG TPA: hypothetical protein VG675_03350 [Bryobacteraceae bacterium]|nr:hypothetical protein [Bryobacteraceae bacterium]
MVGLPLELLIIAALLKGSFKRFPFVLVYTVALFLSTVAEIPAYTAYFSGIQLSHTRAFYFWLSEAILEPLIFCVVVGLIYQATARAERRRIVRAAFSVGPVIFAVVSFLVHYDKHEVVGRWMTLWVRDLSFCSTILDLALWTLLIAAKKKDHQLLMLSGALGILFTGEAIGHSLRQISPATVLPGDILIMLANIVCLYTWWQALRAAPVKRGAAVGTGPQ